MAADTVAADQDVERHAADEKVEAHGGSSVLNGAGEPLPTPDAQDANESGDDDDEGYF